jgi:hypothetical protein
MKPKPDNRLLPAELKLANEYVTAGRTPELTGAVTGYIANGVKLVDFKEYFATTRKYFYSLPKDATLDGCTDWPRWLEHHFEAYTKLQKDYINRLARPKREQSSPRKKTETDTESNARTHKEISREITASDFSIEELEYLAKTVAAELERKRSADCDTEPVALVVEKHTFKPKRAKKVATKKEGPLHRLNRLRQESSAMKVATKKVATKKVKPSPSDSVAQSIDEETDGNPFGYEEEHIDSVIYRINTSAKPNLDELDEMSE